MVHLNLREIQGSHIVEGEALITGAKIKNSSEWKLAEGSSLSAEVLAQIKEGGVFIKTSPTKTKLFSTAGSDRQLYSRCLGAQKADGTLLRSLLDAE